MKNNRGQTLVEASLVLVFITIVMFAFIQICIMLVDDMTINEAAFAAVRSAAVTKSKDRAKEAEIRVKDYIEYFYPISNSNGHFVFSNKVTVDSFLSAGESDEEIAAEDSAGKAVTIWKGDKTMKDFSGKNIAKQTVKIYYFTKTAFANLIAKTNSSGSKRYQSARNRLFPSPDEGYYYKAFPDAENFKNE
jgi:Flp pilus assembly protein TadG